MRTTRFSLLLVICAIMAMFALPTMAQVENPVEFDFSWTMPDVYDDLEAHNLNRIDGFEVCFDIYNLSPMALGGSPTVVGDYLDYCTLTNSNAYVWSTTIILAQTSGLYEMRAKIKTIDSQGLHSEYSEPILNHTFAVNPRRLMAPRNVRITSIVRKPI